MYTKLHAVVKNCRVPVGIARALLVSSVGAVPCILASKSVYDPKRWARYASTSSVAERAKKAEAKRRAAQETHARKRKEDIAQSKSSEKLRPSNLVGLSSAIRTALAQPKGTPGRQERARELRAQLRERFKASDDPVVLQLFLDLDCDALNALHSDDSSRTAQVEVLLVSLSRWAAYPHHDLSSLDEAVKLCRMLHADPANARVLGALRNTLADVLLAQRQCAGHGSLDEIISLRREALDLIPGTHPSRADACIKLAHPLVMQSRDVVAPTIKLKHEGDEPTTPPICEALALLSEALRLHPPGHCDRARTRSDVLHVTDAMVALRPDSLSVEALEPLWRAALETTTEPSPERIKTLVYFGECLRDRGLDQNQSHFEVAVAMWRAVLRGSAGDGPTRRLALERLSDLLYFHLQDQELPRNPPPSYIAAATEIIELEQEFLRLLPVSRDMARGRHQLQLSETFLRRAKDKTDIERVIPLLRDARPRLRENDDLWTHATRLLITIFKAQYQAMRDAKLLIEAQTLERELASSRSYLDRIRAAASWVRRLVRPETGER